MNLWGIGAILAGIFFFCYAYFAVRKGSTNMGIFIDGQPNIPVNKAQNKNRFKAAVILYIIFGIFLIFIGLILIGLIPIQIQSQVPDFNPANFP